MSRTIVEQTDASVVAAGTWATITDNYASGGGIVSCTMTGFGAYSVAPTGVTFTAVGGMGSGATATLTTSGVSPNIQVTAVNMTANGSHYMWPPVAAFTGGTGTPASTAPQMNSGYLRSSTAGSTITITVPTGVSGVLLLCQRIANGAPGNVATVTVDGVLQADTWNQNDYTTAAASAGQLFSTGSVVNEPLAWSQSAYRPIRFTNTGVTHTIVIGISSGTVTFDAYETYAAVAAPTVGRVVSIGHSIAAGQGVTTAQRYGGLIAANIGGAEDNAAVGGEAFSTGAANPAGWPRYAGIGTWWDQTPEVALWMEARNDSFFLQGYDPGGGLGYVIERFKQRTRELLWRMSLNSPNTLIIVIGVLPETTAMTAGATRTDRLAYDAALQSVCGEATMVNVYFAHLWPVMENNGIGSDMTQDGIHPTVYGHTVVAREVLRKVQWSRGRQGGRVGGLF